MHAKKEKIYPAFVSRKPSNCVKQAILLIIPNGKGWHYIAEKKLTALLRALTSKTYGDFYCLNCFHSFWTINKVESHKRVYGKKDVCNIIMPSEEIRIL